MAKVQIKSEKSCSEEIVDMVEAHCRHFYIRANRCSSFYDSMFALTGWKTVEINGIEFELNSILVVKCRCSTSELQRELVSLSTHKVGGIRGVAVKCLDITKNSDCEGSSPSAPPWQGRG